VNRRTVLQSAGVVGVASLAGCIDGVEEHFTGGVQSPVPIEVLNEGSQPYNISLEGRARDGDRETYDENFAIIPDERVWAPQVEGSDQQFRVTRFGEDETDEDDADVEVVEITEVSQLILITMDDDNLEIELISDEDEADERQEEGDADEELPDEDD
jgi:hypothetical protein